MNPTLSVSRLLATFLVLGIATSLPISTNGQAPRTPAKRFRVTSSTFANNAALPINAIHNIIVNNVNVCSIDGSPGGNQSPELSWQQVFNDFFIAPEYDGPCPPANVVPFVHHYVFTVYALDVQLQLPQSQNFPATAETLYQALIAAGRDRHILASASLTGLYSTTPPQ